MIYQKKARPIMSTVAYKGRLWVAPALIMMLFVSFSGSGCASGKGGNEISGVMEKPVDSSLKAESNRRNIAQAQTTTEKGTDEDLIQENQNTPATSRIRPIKRPAELKPLLAVMQGKTSDQKKNVGPSPKIHVELAFDNADLHEVLDVTLYELFRVNYMVDPSIKAKVTFHLSGDFTKIQFINVLNNVLQLNDLAIVKGPGDIFKVVRRASSAGSGNAPLAKEAEAGQAGDLTRMLRLRYIGAATGARNIKPFLSKNAVVVEDAVTNSLVITDTLDNLNKATSLLGMMDVEYFADISWRVFPIKESDASEMARDLERILKTGGLYNRPGIDKGNFEIVPIKTMNALLVVSRWPSMIKLIDDWINAMDHDDDSGTNVFVYFVENGTAVELADILNQLYGGTASGTSKKVAIVKPSVKPGLAGELSGEVEIIPDETNNAIVFKATGRDYRIIKEVLKKLDIVPRQVLINVVIAEITLDGLLEYGVQWFLKDSAQDNYKVQGRLDDGTDLPFGTDLGSGVEGLTLALYDSENALRGLITALETEGEVNILSSPNILAVDNKEAVIEVGEQVPIPTGETTTDTGTVRSIQYRDTGVLLTVTPHINSSGLIKIEMIQEVSEIGTKDEDLDAYSFLNRKAETSLVVEDGQTIILGGLMRSKLDSSGSGIPFLRRIPLLGYLFGGTRKEIDKTELIFLITPRIISTRAEADVITREFSQRVDDMKKLIEEKEF
jgi:general secretion pathway protein D